MVDALVVATRKAGFPCRKEQGLDDRSRPGDVFVNRLDVDGPGAIDVTVRDPLASSARCHFLLAPNAGKGEKG